MNEHQISAFWSKVDVSPDVRKCWNWMAAKTSNGYGNVRINKKYLGAHRVAFEIINGKVPEGFIICHVCDNKSCCNPHHLMLGTVRSNAIDMVIKGRSGGPRYAMTGTQNHNSKLNDEKVKEIRESYKSGSMDQYELARKYGVTQSTIGYITRNKTWRHVV